MKCPAVRVLLAVVAAITPLAGTFAWRARAAAADGSPGAAKVKADASGAAAACAQGPLAAFADYLGSDVARPKRAVAERLPGRLSPIIVTIADPIDSRLDAAFDETLAALTLAATNVGYTLDRFWLPWLLDARQGGAPGALQDCHMRQPGVVLFRPPRPNPRLEEGPPRTRPGEETPGLALLLVSETPTTGVAAGALQAAMTLVNALQLPDGGFASRRVPVLGPTFSGSAASLARELRSFSDRGFAVVTGSATADIGSVIADDPRVASREAAVVPQLTFQTTTHVDQDLWNALFNYLCHIGVDPGSVALLMETGTVYAAGLRSTFEFRRPLHDEEEFCGSPDRPPRPRTILRFPLHVSRIRSDYDQQRGAERDVLAGLVLPAQALRLHEEAKRDAKDVLPALSGASENAEELALGRELDMIRRRGIRAVGVLATDPLDKIFLVTKLRDYVPDALVFTLESNLLFLHPDVRSALYGSLVATTYPLLADAQGWTARGPGRGRIQFASSAAEGIYNAAALTLESYLAPPRTDGPAPQTQVPDYDCSLPGLLPGRGGPPVCGLAPRTQVLDYDCPFPGVLRGQGGPPVWISVVGRDAIWPVWIDRCEAGRGALTCDAAGACSDPRGALQRRVSAPRASHGLLALAAFVALVTALHALAALLSRVLRVRRGPYAAARPPAHAQARWLALHLGWLGLISLALSVALHIPDAVPLERSLVLREARWDWASGVARLAAAAAGLALAAAGFTAGRCLLGPDRPAGVRARGDRTASPQLTAGAVCALAALAVGVPAGLLSAVPSLARALAGRLGPAWTLLLFERVSDLASGVSPLLPLLSLAFTVHLATSYQLMRIRLLDAHDGLPGRRGLLSKLARLRDSAFLRHDGELAARVRARYSRRDVLLGGAFVLAPIAILAYGFPRFHSPDGPGFDRLFAGLLAAVIVIAGSTLCRAWRLWCALRGALERLPGHPIAAALKRMPELFGPERMRQLLWRGPQPRDLEACRRALRAALPVGVSPASRLGIEAAMSADRRRPARACWNHASVAALVGAAVAMARMKPVPGASPVAGADAAARAGEDFVASQLTLTVFWTLAHLRWLVTFSVVGAMSILGAVAFYPFQPMRLLLLLIWIVVLGAAASAIAIYVQHGRNEVLSWLSCTPPGRVSLDASHLYRFASLGAAPIVALLALEFPTLGHWLARWLAPLLGVMK